MKFSVSDPTNLPRPGRDTKGQSMGVPFQSGKRPTGVTGKVALPILCCRDTASRKVIFFCGRMRLNSFERKERFMSDEKTLFRGSSSPVVIIGTLLLCGSLMIAAVAASFSLHLTGFSTLGGGWTRAGIRTHGGCSSSFESMRSTERIRRTTGILTRRTDELGVSCQDVTWSSRS
jgi:hypothetical protein